MTISIVSNASQPLSPLTTTATDSSATVNDKGPVSIVSSSFLAQDTRPFPVDTVSISSQSQQKAINLEKEDVQKEINQNTSDKSGGAVAKVQFVYNPKGELSLRYMDTASRLIYQTPSELMQRLKEALTKSGTSVDTNA
ncbi:MAG: hypothetical protein PHI31_18130 [Desulfuromonadaceae bacterium]|nr:hypothetical protein [Desulfuromonadaceae bacterium]